MFQRTLSGYPVTCGIGLCHQRGYGCRETYAQRHRDKHKTVAKGYCCEFGRAQLPHHDIVGEGHKGMPQHPQDYRCSQPDIISEFPGILMKQNPFKFGVAKIYASFGFSERYSL